MTRSGGGGLVVGIDGGATRTSYAVADGGGRTIVTSEGPASLLGAGRDEAVAEDLARSIATLLSDAGGRPPAAALCAGLAGAASRPDAAERVRANLLKRGVAERVRVVSDADVALLDAFGEGPGILVVSGTGSIACVRGRDGALLRTGGWGALIGDEGSGYRIGLSGIRAAVRGVEGRGEPTGLSRTMFETLDVQSPHELYLWSCTATKSAVAALAPLVVGDADRGDPVALGIVEEAVSGLVSHARALATREEVSDGADPGSEVALAGGLVEPRGVLRERLSEALIAAGFRVLASPVDPVRGAVAAALAILPR